MRLLSIILLLLISSSSFSQEDLTGTWEGSGGGAPYAKICIIRYNNTYVGFTYDEGMGFCKCHFVGEYDPNKKKLKGVNKGVIEKTFLHSQSRYNLNYVVIGGQEYLRGTIAAKTAVVSIPSPITYTRSSTKVDTTDFMLAWLRDNVPGIQEEVAKQDPPPVSAAPRVVKDTAIVIAPPAVAIAKADTVKPVIQKPVPTVVPVESIIVEKNKRNTDTLSVINTNATELIIKVMDNGVVDGDTVSIIHNGRVIAERLSVKATPYEIKIPMDNVHNRQEIVLVAHNLGSIAPNTALIIIETPEKQHRLTASTDLKKNAMIIFQYRDQ